MKKLLLIFAAIGIVFFTSCEKESDECAWRTTHQYFSLKVDNPENYPEDFIDNIEQEISKDVSKAESYRLSFNKDGTGRGSGVRHYGAGRYDFDFEWEKSDTEISFTEIGDGYGGIFFTYDWTALENISWEIEEYSANKMVLEMTRWAIVDGEERAWAETHTYRYTFEKVK
jgi:hypothetical protein